MKQPGKSAEDQTAMQKKKPMYAILTLASFFLLSLTLFGVFAAGGGNQKKISSNVVIESSYSHHLTNEPKPTLKEAPLSPPAGQTRADYLHSAMDNWQTLQGIPVLCYHKIADAKAKSDYDVYLNSFREQMHYLHKNNYRTISLHDFYAYIRGEKKFTGFKPVVITFDDGLKDYLKAEPVMDEFGFKGVLFIYPTYIISKRKVVLTPAQIKGLHARGHEIQSHTYWHPLLNLMSPEEQNKQFSLSSKWIEKLVGNRVRFLAYPFGIFDNHTFQELSQTGYLAAFTIFEGENLPGQNPYLLNRYMVVTQDKISSFHAKITRKSLPVFSIAPVPGTQLERNDVIHLKIPRNLDKSHLNVTASGGLLSPRWVYQEQDGSLEIYPALKNTRYLTVTIAFRQNGNLYQNKLLYNVNQKQKVAVHPTKNRGKG